MRPRSLLATIRIWLDDEKHLKRLAPRHRRILLWPSRLPAKFLSREINPVRIPKHSAADHDRVGLAGAYDGFRLRGPRDEADR